MAYAWTNFPVYDENGKLTKNIAPGDDVSAGDLGISDEEFEELQFIGAVRDNEYPTPKGYEGSPIEYAKEQLAQMALEGEGGEFFLNDGSMKTTPQMDLRAQAAMVKTGYDPEKSPEDQSLENTVDEDADEANAKVARKSASAEQPATKPVPPVGASAGNS